MDCLVECEQLGSAGSLWCNMFSGRQQTRARVEAGLLAAERTWLDMKGLPDRPWYRNTYISDDPMSGYAASPLPEIHAAWRDQDADRFRAAVPACAGRVDQLADRLEAMKALAQAAP